MKENETALPQVSSFTDEEFIAFLEAAGFWVDNLVADEPEA